MIMPKMMTEAFPVGPHFPQESYLFTHLTAD